MWLTLNHNEGFKVPLILCFLRVPHSTLLVFAIFTRRNKNTKLTRACLHNHLQKWGMYGLPSNNCYLFFNQTIFGLPLLFVVLFRLSINWVQGVRQTKAQHIFIYKIYINNKYQSLFTYVIKHINIWFKNLY